MKSRNLYYEFLLLFLLNYFLKSELLKVVQSLCDIISKEANRDDKRLNERRTIKINVVVFYSSAYREYFSTVL